MSTFFLIRHAVTDLTGSTLSGRSPGLRLNCQGLRQAEQLAGWLAHHPIQHLFSSPLERARQTAEPLAKALGLTMHIAEALTDIDFGDWTGRTLDELRPLEQWKQWNSFRSSLRIPNGETMTEVQSRMLKEVERLFRAFPDDCLALVSHADPIRTVIAHYLGMPLDLLPRLEISPASVSLLAVSPWSAQVRCLNLEIGLN